ncbi:MAG TPA: ankyrin repeat domain-containing protein, partial [Gammaproteobacteria bacterium]|nr:ankyrin repeat domain-containing protein [Gammaproteobacteria bacterium]
ARNKYNRTPLHIAVDFDHVELVRKLITEFHVDVNIQDNLDYKPILYHAIKNDRCFEIIRLLVQEGKAETHILDKNGNNLLHIAVQKNQIDTVRLLIKSDIDINAYNNFKVTALTFAIDLDLVEIVAILVGEGKADVSIKDTYQNNCLHQAVRLQRKEIVQILISKGNANIEDRTPEGNTPLLIAALLGNQEIAHLILQCNADVNAQNNQGTTALHLAMIPDDPTLALMLIREHDADVNVINNGGCTPLHIATGFSRTEIIQALINEKHADVNAKDHDGYTPLAWAVINSNVPLIHRYINEFHADPMITDNFGNNVLALAAMDGLFRSVNALLDVDALRNNPNAGEMLALNGNLTLARAAAEGNIEIVNRLLAYPEVEQSAAINNNAILRAAQANNHVAVVERLMQIPAVRNIPIPELGLMQVAQFNENAMQTLDDNQQGMITIVKQHYQQKMQSIGQDAVLENLKKYLETQYDNKPAQDPSGIKLPLEPFNPHLPSQEPYYKNIYHTARRYLFLRPNPWIFPNANYTDELPDGRAASIPPMAKTDIAYFWLAASDTSYLPTAEFTHKKVMKLFTRRLADIGRAHNWDKYRVNAAGKLEQYDDLEGDKPSCDVGINQRLVQSVMGNPITQQPQARELNPSIFRNKFIENLLFQHEDYTDNLYARLNQLSLQLLSELKEALENEVVLCEPLTDAQEACFYIPEEQIDAFIEEAKTWFSANRITAPLQTVKWLTRNYENYVEFANDLSNDVKKHFHNEVVSILETLILQKTPISEPEIIKTTDVEADSADDMEADKPRKRRRL